MSAKKSNVREKIVRKNLEAVQNDLDTLHGSTPPPGPAARLHWLGKRAASEGRILLALSYYAEAQAAEDELPDDLWEKITRLGNTNER